MNLIQVPAPLPSIAPLPGGGTIPQNFFPTQAGCFDLGSLILLVGFFGGFLTLLYLALRTNKNEVQSHGHR